MAHKVFVGFLFFVTLSATVSVGIKGFSFYTTSVPDRPFHPDYATLKTSGTYSHGLGIVGALMIVIGVTIYSTRKRVRRLWNLGKLSRWLEVHISLCLLGPILVIYHSTFKAGGIAAISLWCMVSVAASGVIGRFLYVQIPRGIKGNELSAQDIRGELDRLSGALSTSPLGAQVARMVDERFASLRKPEQLMETVATIFRLQSMRRHVGKTVAALIARSSETGEHARELKKLASLRASLMQKTVVLAQVERLFFYWHAIHLPFTVIMFIALAAHVGVTMFLGYRWIF